MPDADLRRLFRLSLPGAQWTPVETGATAAGVPDAEYCFAGGASGWVEFKATRGWQVKKSRSLPFQVAWHEERARCGGRSFVAVRQQLASGRDDLYVVHGSVIRSLASGARLDEVPLLSYSSGGPRCWSWSTIKEVLACRSAG
jgi:hypothetical protein